MYFEGFVQLTLVYALTVLFIPLDSTTAVLIVMLITSIAWPSVIKAQIKLRDLESKT